MILSEETASKITKTLDIPGRWIDVFVTEGRKFQDTVTQTTLELQSYALFLNDHMLERDKAAGQIKSALYRLIYSLNEQARIQQERANKLLDEKFNQLFSGE